VASRTLEAKFCVLGLGLEGPGLGLGLVGTGLGLDTINYPVFIS